MRNEIHFKNKLFTLTTLKASDVHLLPSQTSIAVVGTPFEVDPPPNIIVNGS
jgi:hypothetical protein